MKKVVARVAVAAAPKDGYTLMVLEVGTLRIPTLIESGVPEYVMGSWQGVLAPAGTPAAIVKKLQLAIAEVLNDPAMRQRLEGQGAEVIGNTPEEFGALLAGQAKTFLAVGRQAHVKPQ